MSAMIHYHTIQQLLSTTEDTACKGKDVYDSFKLLRDAQHNAYTTLYRDSKSGDFFALPLPAYLFASTRDRTLKMPVDVQAIQKELAHTLLMYARTKLTLDLHMGRLSHESTAFCQFFDEFFSKFLLTFPLDSKHTELAKNIADQRSQYRSLQIDKQQHIYAEIDPNYREKKSARHSIMRSVRALNLAKMSSNFVTKIRSLIPWPNPRKQNDKEFSNPLFDISHAEEAAMRAKKEAAKSSPTKGSIT